MRELTIKEKAEAYDVAVERATKLYENANGMILKKWVEQVFPALKESEDEGNIKKLIDELKCSLRGAICQNESNRGGQEKRIALLEWAIAWLEKQGEQKPACEVNCTTTTEWSKDDDICINSIINSLGVFAALKPEYKVMNQRNITWLKALRAQRTWKPSKGQMKALEEASNEHWEPDGLDPLYTLLQDLKKLEGE